MKKHFVSIDEKVKLWIETLGDSGNEACLLISGAGANSSFWSERLCRHLAEKDFFVIKYDHRDFGYSTKIDFTQHPYDFMQLVKDAVAILDTLQVEKAHIVGHSMGGFIAQLMAIHFPDRVISIISASASTNSPLVPPPPDKTWKIFMENSPANDFENDLSGFMRIWEYLNGTARFDRELAVDYTRNLYERQAIIGALGESHVKAQASLSDRSEILKSVDKPALIIHGEEDYLVDKYGGIQTAESLPKSKLVLIPKMGHIPFNREILDRFESEIIQFISRNWIR
ncbi:alpha/beta fold hydrolase [Maribellus sediminis]|uniref:alpha/beta fold hydrolase n=1 Tax=Maribellus sediminis TaxID=2696285 RepID=UPI00142FCFAE|nr:alpha/beta hydrolase [Maribellus sediminis]